MAFAATARQSAMSATMLLLLVVFTLLVVIPSTPAATIPAVPPRNDTCMTRWLTAATVGSGVSNEDVQRFERLLKKFETAVDEDTVHDTDQELLETVLGGNEQAVNFLYRCMGNHDDTECLRQSPCQHLGRCVYSREPGSSGSPYPGYRCVCSRGVRGRFCQHALPSCSSSPCKNGGTCQETSEGYTCQCPTLYTGRHCQKQWLSKHILANMTSSLSKLTSITYNVLAASANAEKKSSDTVATFLSRLQVTVNRNLDQRLEAMQRNHTTYVQSSERNSANLRQDLNAVKSSLRYLGTGCNLRTLGYKYQSRHSINYSPDKGQITSVTFRKKHTNTVLKLSYSGNIRTATGNTGARWYLNIDNRECARPTKIDIMMYQNSGDNTFVPAVLTGICESTYSSGANIAAGDHTITVHVGRLRGYAASDAHTGYLSTSILEIQEMCPQF
ncbi:uncharacterized protein LOC135826547 isoform X3 [Sycon ciliatum]|uniref:uncharacterized protein LOC135826547 isoform X3 n=1 Tax=Sycon ciliatum TaxID=27933 RepID=UPI0031F6E058